MRFSNSTSILFWLSKLFVSLKVKSHLADHYICHPFSKSFITSTRSHPRIGYKAWGLIIRVSGLLRISDCFWGFVLTVRSILISMRTKAFINALFASLFLPLFLFILLTNHYDYQQLEMFLFGTNPKPQGCYQLGIDLLYCVGCLNFHINFTLYNFQQAIFSTIISIFFPFRDIRCTSF